NEAAQALMRARNFPQIDIVQVEIDGSQHLRDEGNGMCSPPKFWYPVPQGPLELRQNPLQMPGIGIPVAETRHKLEQKGEGMEISFHRAQTAMACLQLAVGPIGSRRFNPPLFIHQDRKVVERY